MKGLQELRTALARYLKEQGMEAAAAWGEERRLRAGKAVAVVSLRGFESGTPGFQNYLGERYNTAEGRWEELYGKRVELTFGLDVYAASAEEVLLEREGRLDLLRLIHGLPPEPREVVYLRAFGGLSFREIGDVCGRTETWARVTFYRSKEKLRNGGARDEE